MTWTEREQKLDPYRAWLSLARRRKRLTQKQAAQALGVSVSAYRKYEYGLRSPSEKTARKINRVLGISAPKSAWGRGE